MTVHATKTFKSGNSAAVRLPKELGFAPGMSVRIERQGLDIVIRAVTDIEEERRKMRELIAELKAIGAPEDGVQPRPEFEAPDRIDFR